MSGFQQFLARGSEPGMIRATAWSPRGGHVSIDAAGDPTAAGHPGTYAELRALPYQSLTSHIASLISVGSPGALLSAPTRLWLAWPPNRVRESAALRIDS